MQKQQQPKQTKVKVVIIKSGRETEAYFSRGEGKTKEPVDVREATKFISDMKLEQESKEIKDGKTIYTYA